MQISGRFRHNLLRERHRAERKIGQQKAEHHDHNTGEQRKGQRRVYTLRNGILVSRPVVLRDNDTAARREADEETDKEIDQLSRRAADRGERGVGADKVAHNNGIDRIVELLKKGTEQNRKEKQ